MLELADNLKKIQQTISQSALKVGRDPKEVTLIGVSKKFPVEVIESAYGLGLRDFGENRAQEYRDKMRRLSPELLRGTRWHFVGQLQSNKVKYLLNHCYLIHSLDRWSVVEEMVSLAGKEGINWSALVQVNVSGEKSKGGLSPQELPDFLRDVSQYPAIRVEGLMTMAPLVDDPEEARPYFRNLATLAKEMQVLMPNLSLRHLSMGMSDDFSIAIEEGATLIRVGEALFGRRPVR